MGPPPALAKTGLIPIPFTRAAATSPPEDDPEDEPVMSRLIMRPPTWLCPTWPSMGSRRLSSRHHDPLRQAGVPFLASRLGERQGNRTRIATRTTSRLPLVIAV